MTRRSRILIAVAAILLVGLAGVAQYLRANYDVIGIIEWTITDLRATHTDGLEATPSDLDELIAAARSTVGSKLPRSPTRGPLRVHPANPRYFQDADGEAVYLTGSHTWSNFQDNGHGDPPPVFDYEQYLDFLEAHGHNFTRLWVWESSRWSVQTRDDEYWFNPEAPFLRTGPGEALDGKPRWDLEQLDDTWFARLRERVADANDRGLYVAVMLFDGWSVANRKGSSDSGENPWRSHPFNGANNINGIDGDRDGDGSGLEVHELGDSRVLAIQEAYLRRVVDALNGLDNVLYEVSNESHAGSVEWQYHVIDYLNSYQSTKPSQHPVGMTVTFPGGSDEALYESNADWIAPRDYRDPSPTDGRKVVVADTDHVFGIGGDRTWIWRAFVSGAHPIFMDGYDAKGYGVGGKAFPWAESVWHSLRINMGHTRRYAMRMDLSTAVPDADACSTGYCLVADNGVDGTHIIAYSPIGGSIDVDLSNVPGTVAVEWFDPASGEIAHLASVEGGEWRTFAPPFPGDVVLYLSPGRQ